AGARLRLDGRDELADLRSRHQGSPSGRLFALRFVLAARSRAAPRGHHLPGRPSGGDVQQEFRRSPDPHSDEEYRLRRRDGGGARYRHGRRQYAAGRKIRRQEGAARIEPQGAAAGLPVRQTAFRVSAAVSSGKDGRQQRQDPDRRQYRDGVGSDLRRMHRRGLVSDHAGDVGDGRLQRFLRAEDELAAIGMVLGACWNGARAFTSTAGPGLSLMNELIGFGYYAEIPAVIVDVQRVGPSTGMPTRTQQADLVLA